MEASEVTVREFVARINQHDVTRITALCTAEHYLIDSLGRVLTGAERLREAWSGYFALFPDYCIEIELLAAADESVLLAGVASGTAALRTPKEHHWRIPAAWRARVRDNLIDIWQVYADNKPVYELLARDV